MAYDHDLVELGYVAGLKDLGGLAERLGLAVPPRPGLLSKVSNTVRALFTSEVPVPETRDREPSPVRRRRPTPSAEEREPAAPPMRTPLSTPQTREPTAPLMRTSPPTPQAHRSTPPFRLLSADKATALIQLALHDPRAWHGLGLRTSHLRALGINKADIMAHLDHWRAQDVMASFGDL